MRKNSLFILLLVALLSLPTFAFADASIEELSGGKGVGWQGIIASGDDAGLYGAVVRARNKYNAACWVFGKNPLTIPDEVRSKLSDPDYGGRFYEYANSFNSIIDWEYVPDWEPTYSTLSYILYGFDFQWESAVPQSLYEGAKEDFRRVLTGEDLSGGGSSGSTNGLYVELSSNCVNNSGASNLTYSNPALNATFEDGELTLGSGYVEYSPYINNSHYVSHALMYVHPSLVAFANSQIEIGKVVSYYFVADGRNTSSGKVGLIVADSLSYVYTGSSNEHYYVPSGTNIQYWTVGSSAYYDGTDLFFVFPDASPTLTAATGTVWVWYFSPVISTVQPVPSSPSGTWPTPEIPVTPDPPEVPTPTAPTVTPDPTPTEPTPTWPDITINIPAPPTVEVTPTGLDYTELLTRINDNLNTINSYSVSINNSLNSLRSDLVSEFDGVIQGLRNIYQYLQHLDDLLERHCKHIRDSIDENIYELELYLKGLFEWLPQQLNFDAEFTYDDSSVVNWLKQIYSKLGGGTSAPNPVADPGGFFEWLGGLIAGFIAGIVAGLPGKLQELVSDITDLTEFFPFSAPWDIYAMLLLFAHDPVTPVFSIPWGLGSGNVVNVVVDCTQWDGVMTIVRSVEKIIFAGGLAKLTFNMFKPTDVMGD